MQTQQADENPVCSACGCAAFVEFPDSNVLFCTGCGSSIVIPEPAVSTRQCPNPSCDNGLHGKLNIVRDESHMVCALCHVVIAGLPYTVPFDNQVVQEQYKRGFYYNEVISQWQLEEPPIPEDLLALLDEAGRRYRNVHPGPLHKDDIHEICKSVSTVRHTAIKPRLWVRISNRLSKTFAARRTATPLTNLRKYGEKWRTLIYRWEKRRPPRANNDMLNSIRMFCGRVDMAFEEVRHKPDCKRYAKCHKDVGCRKNIFNTSYILKKAILNCCGGDRKHPFYLAQKPWFPQVNASQRHRIKERFWLPIVKRCNFRHWGKSQSSHKQKTYA